MRITSDNRPTDYEYALMSDHVYLAAPLSEGTILPKTSQWKIRKIYPGEMGYFGAVYCNNETRQMVLAHRGTDSIKAVIEDIWGIWKPEGFSPQKKPPLNV